MSPLFIILTILVVILIACAVWRMSNGWRALLVLGGVCAWLIWLGLNARRGFFADFSRVPPPLVWAGVLPAMLAGLALLFYPPTRRFLHSFPAAWLIGFQVFRVPLELILWGLHADGLLPVQMTFEGRNFDVVPALLACPVAYWVAQRKSWARPVALAWNLLGFVMVVNVATTGALSTPGPLRVFMNEPANYIVGQFPFAWLPAFLVPLALFGHLASFSQQWDAGKSRVSY
jgi:hypothetical protein